MILKSLTIQQILTLVDKLSTEVLIVCLIEDLMAVSDIDK